MRLLFDDTLSPMTDDLGFLECSLATVICNYQSWMQELGHGIKRRLVWGTLQNTLETLLPFGLVEKRRVLFVPTQSNWVAYFDNGWRGSEADARIGYLHQRIGCRGICAVSVPNTIRGNGRDARGRYGANMFTVYSPDADNVQGGERSISAMNDGGSWSFDVFGEPYEFEDTEQYKARRIRDRFTPEMLDEYLKHFGIDAYNEDFYTTSAENPAILFERTDPPYPNDREVSLEEARAHY